MCAGFICLPLQALEGGGVIGRSRTGRPTDPRRSFPSPDWAGPLHERPRGGCHPPTRPAAVRSTTRPRPSTRLGCCRRCRRGAATFGRCRASSTSACRCGVCPGVPGSRARVATAPLRPRTRRTPRRPGGTCWPSLLSTFGRCRTSSSRCDECRNASLPGHSCTKCIWCSSNCRRPERSTPRCLGCAGQSSTSLRHRQSTTRKRFRRGHALPRQVDPSVSGAAKKGVDDVMGEIRAGTISESD